jgi:AAA+ ATPase superfamily predicted ATPase
MPKDRSPFTPGRPVPVEFFIGRLQEIERVLRSVRQVAAGKQENIFLTGERGMGKSSLAAFVRYLAEKEHGFLGVHVYMGAVNTVEEFVRKTFERLLQESIDKPIFEKIKTFFGNHIKQVGLFGVSVKLEMDPNDLRNAVSNFLPALDRLYDRIRDEKKGVLLVLDDINGITASPEFAHFLKSMVDEIATRQKHLPLLLLLAGVPERRDEMIRNQESVGRISDVIEIKPFSREETDKFYQKAFDAESVSVDDEALALLYRYSGGLPMLLHEVGDAVFWADSDNRITKNDALGGIIEAADIVGKKYLDRQVYRAIRSDRYRSILQKIVKPDLTMRFVRKEIANRLTEYEKRVLDNFLGRMKDLGVVRSGEHAGEYVFANNLFRLYMALESVSKQNRVV